jgi:hypothetical protein
LKTCRQAQLQPGEIRIRVKFNGEDFAYEFSERATGRILVVLQPQREERRVLAHLFSNPADHVEPELAPPVR